MRLHRDAPDEIPVLAMLRGAPALERRASALAALIEGAKVVDGDARASAAARCRCSSCPARSWRWRAPDALAAALRRGDPPLVGRIERGRLLLDPRTWPTTRSSRPPARSPPRVS